MAEYKIEHGGGCQASLSSGECPNKPLDGSDYCAMHGGNRSLAATAAKNLRMYRLTQYQSTLNDFADHSNLKSLREEIAILRILLQERLNVLQSPVEIIAHTHTISDLCTKIEKLVTSCHKLEKSMGEYLGKSELLQLGAEMVGIINKYVDNPEIVERISGELIERITKTETAEDDN